MFHDFFPQSFEKDATYETAKVTPSPPFCCSAYMSPWYTLGSAASGIILPYEWYQLLTTRGRARRC